MKREPATDPTVLTADSDRRRIALALYPLRRSAQRIAADCERMFEIVSGSDKSGWRDAIADALVGSRHLLTVTVQAGDVSDITQATQRISTLGARIAEPQRRVVNAMTKLLGFLAVTPEEELLLQDAKSVREAATDLVVLKASASANGQSGESRAVDGVAAGDVARQRALVLVVDDEAAIRNILSRRLKHMGHAVVEAANGRVAIEVVAREPVDMVLTDINMPELDGIGLLEELKGADATRHLPVIVISSQNDLASVVRCIELGAEDHISKPFEPALLLARVQACLERKRMRDHEQDYLRRVGKLTAAAEAVEAETYAAGSLASLVAQSDELGRLARVFDRMVTGLKSKEERLQHRLRQLRHELGEASGKTTAAAMSADSPFRSGEILAARYEILAHLGDGGMGMVYRARDIELGEQVAVKVVRRDLVHGDPTIVERLKEEIRLARRISHKNVVRAHDLGEWKGTYFITMEYVKGITVAELLDRRGRLAVDSTLAIGTQLAEALAVAHEQEIIHRDIKPANLLIGDEGTVKVMDFGIARSINRKDDITLAGFIVGTPHYMAPEQLMGGKVDSRSDLFAVGVVLYECLAGRPPFRAEASTALLAQIAEGNFVRLGELVAHVPAELEAIVYQLLRFQPSERFNSARQLADKLTEIEHAAGKDSAAALDDIILQIIEPVAPA